MNRPLPVVLRPLPGEVLRSWLERVGSLYGMTTSELLNAYSRNDDFAINPSQGLLDQVSALTRYPVEALRRSTFSWMYPSWPEHWISWLPPLWTGSRKEVFLEPTPALQICRQCLQVDRLNGTQFLRLRWLSAAATFCRIHHAPLETTCTVCPYIDPLICKRVSPRFLFICSYCEQVQDRCDQAIPSLTQPMIILMEFENALEQALDRQDVAAHWMGPCTPAQFLTAVEDVVWALTRPNYPHGRAPIERLQTFAFPLRKRFPAHPDIEHWLAHSGVFLRRSLLAAAAAVLCGPDVCGILNDGLPSSLCRSWMGLDRLWFYLPDSTKAVLLRCSSGWPERLRSELTRVSPRQSHI